jgi:hypothetical protein
MDELTRMEIQLEKLSTSFVNTLDIVQKYAPLARTENEEDMENSTQNLDRMNVEKLENYEENRKNYATIIETKSNEMNGLFEEIKSIINGMREKEEYKQTDEELKNNLRNLKEWNELKVKTITDKTKHVEDIINSIKKESLSMDYFD